MNILILGGTGAMGTPLVQILKKSNQLFVTTRSNSHEDEENVTYLKGDAHDLNFLMDILELKYYDAIVDFLIYSTEEFAKRYSLFLDKTKQYIFLSSARVYSDCGLSKITEKSGRLLDTSKDKNYVHSDEYAIRKAKQENILLKSEKHNFTIVRPYITYNNERLQLGIFEKEVWLQRALSNKTIVVNNSVLSKYTTLTFGYDVALRIASLIGNERAYGEIIHIVTDKYIQWKKVLDIYLEVIEQNLGYKPKIIISDEYNSLSKKRSYHQIYCDRMYNRIFDNSKIEDISNLSSEFIPPEIGLKQCLNTFLKDSGKFLFKSWKFEAVFDKITGEKERLSNINGFRNKVIYLLFRYVF